MRFECKGDDPAVPMNTATLWGTGCMIKPMRGFSIVLNFKAKHELYQVAN